MLQRKPDLGEKKNDSFKAVLQRSVQILGTSQWNIYAPTYKNTLPFQLQQHFDFILQNKPLLYVL